MDFNLELIEWSRISFRDGSYRWIDVKEFRQSRSSPNLDTILIPNLLNHPAMRDLYFGYPRVLIDEPIHGPFSLDSLKPEMFQRVSSSEAHRNLLEWTQQQWSLSQEPGLDPVPIDDGIDELYRAIDRSRLIFELHDPKGAEIIPWSAARPEIFLELIVADPEGGVVLIVCTDD